MKIKLGQEDKGKPREGVVMMLKDEPEGYVRAIIELPSIVSC